MIYTVRCSKVRGCAVCLNDPVSCTNDVSVWFSMLRSKKNLPLPVCRGLYFRDVSATMKILNSQLEPPNRGTSKPLYHDHIEMRVFCISESLAECAIGKLHRLFRIG